MGFVRAPDGTHIFYKDWEPANAQPFVFSHGWPLCADAWDGQMLFLLQHGFRVVAHDRRGHGRSDQTGTGNDMDTYADDLAAVMDALDLKNAVMVGHSTGGGEVARYISRHGNGRVARAVLVAAVPPVMVSTPQWPGGLDVSVFDGIRQGVADNRSAFYLDLAIPFFGMNRNGATLSEGLKLTFWNQGMMGSIIGQYACIHEFSQVDYTSDLKKISVSTLVIHGDDDQIVPLAHAGALTVKVVPNATLKIYQGAPHGLPYTHQDQLNSDLLAFARG